jgi:hypothetical protein
MSAYTGEFATAAQARRTLDQLDHIKGLLVHIEREQRDAQRREPDIATIVIRSLACRWLALGKGIEHTAEQVAQRIYGQRSGHVAVQTALRDLPAYLARAAVSPAMTSVDDWAQQLVGTANYNGLLPALAPAFLRWLADRLELVPEFAALPAGERERLALLFRAQAGPWGPL